MNFAVRLEPPAILITGAAIDNTTVFGSLKMARAALDDQVDVAISVVRDTLAHDIAVLQAKATVDTAELRAARKAALKVREADLPSEGPAITTVEVSPEQRRTNELARATLGSKHDEPEAA